MARTIEQIEQEIMQAKDSYTELAELNSVSQTAIWRLWVKLTAFVHQILEKLFDVFKSEIDASIEQNRTGTLLWYVQKAKEFQLGDTLNSLGEYNTIDTGKQIITRASAVEVGSGINLKIAKSEPPEQLNAIEFQSFQDYIQKVKFAGVALNTINLPAEAVLLNIEIFYSDISEEEAKTKVKTAIQAYITSIAFDGKFVVNDMIVRCRQEIGIADLLVNTITIGGNAVSDGRYISLSGYFSFDPEDAANNYNMTNL